MIRRLQPTHFARSAVRLTSSKSFVQKAIHEANRYPQDTRLQLQTLEILEAINPMLVVQRVEKYRFSMCTEAQRVYLSALAQTMNGVHVAALSRSQSVLNSNGVVNLATRNAKSDGKILPMAGTLLWICAATTSVFALVKNDGWTDEIPIRMTSIPAMQWDSNNEKDSKDAGGMEAPDLPRSSKSFGGHLAMWALEHLHSQAYEELTSPYENVSDIHTE